MIKKTQINKTHIEKILIKLNPKIKNKKINLVDNGLLDSFMIIKLILEVEKITKKKFNISKLDRNNFQNLEKIHKIFK